MWKSLMNTASDWWMMGCVMCDAKIVKQNSNKSTTQLEISATTSDLSTGPQKQLLFASKYSHNVKFSWPPTIYKLMQLDNLTLILSHCCLLVSCGSPWSALVKTRWGQVMKTDHVYLAWAWWCCTWKGHFHICEEEEEEEEDSHYCSPHK